MEDKGWVDRVQPQRLAFWHGWFITYGSGQDAGLSRTFLTRATDRERMFRRTRTNCPGSPVCPDNPRIVISTVTSIGVVGARAWRVRMREAITRIREFLVREDGPTLVQYAVMLTLIIGASFVAIQALGTSARDVFQALDDQLIDVTV